MLELPKNFTLSNLQKYIKDVTKANGWDKSTDLELYLLLAEEVGELAKAIRYERGLYVETGREFSVGEELADILSYILDLANHYGIDLEEEFRRKELKNRQREWRDLSGHGQG